MSTPRDLDALVARARVTAGHDAAVLLMPHEALALIAEVERLREFRNNALHAGGDEAAEERAAVVAFLRDCDTHCREHDGRENAVSATYRIAANVIERGEHRREEDK